MIEPAMLLSSRQGEQEDVSSLLPEKREQAACPLDYELPIFTTYSLSVVLPVYNEEQAITSTIDDVLKVLRTWVKDFEVIAVNDGSTDSTGDILAAIARREPSVRPIIHAFNQGYGAALATGFAAATKELTYFMDADGQFDCHDLPNLLDNIEECDAVIGYRIHRQDAWTRRLNAWGWNQLVRVLLGVRVRDIDCAFKLLPTDFLHRYPPETRGAMINAEILYKLLQAGYTYQEVGVRHLPRRGGKATGANMRVIVRAFRELFTYAYAWRHDTRSRRALVPASERPYL